MYITVVDSIWTCKDAYNHAIQVLPKKLKKKKKKATINGME